MASPVIHGPAGRTEPERFIDMVHVDVGDCWNWIGGKKAAGYGQFAIRRSDQAHAKGRFCGFSCRTRYFNRRR